MQQSALFLDRDGVINVNHGYVHTREKFQFIDGIFDVAKKAYENNYRIIVVTNQSGIGRGFYTEKQFLSLMKWMCGQFSNAGSPIDRVYFSPYHPTEGIGEYLKDDYSRKPHPGMILEAQREFDINLSTSILIGDNCSDIEAGNASGIGTNLLFSLQSESALLSLKYTRITKLSEALPFLRNTYLTGGI